MSKTIFARANKLVVKIGSSLVTHENGSPQNRRMETLAQDIAALQQAGKAVVLVSSGAVALGRKTLSLPCGRALKLEEKQAAAAAGQVRLMAAFEAAFSLCGIKVAQALLTREDTENRRRWLNARATLDTLLERGCVPVVNENDTVATEEIRYGDNDRLAARVAQMIGANILVLLSDTDGLYSTDPRQNPKAQHIAEIREITEQIHAMAKGPNRERGLGSGGMETKLEAASLAMQAGCATAIASGHETSPLSGLQTGKNRASWFLPCLTPQSARRKWLAGMLRPCGSVQIDAGAEKALAAGASLLHAGITRVEGVFGRGDAIEIQDLDGKMLAYGISAYSSDDSRALIGRKSSEIPEILGYAGRTALVHRDDLAMHGVLSHTRNMENSKKESKKNG